MRRGNLALQRLTALLAGLGAFLGLGFLNCGRSAGKHPSPHLGKGNGTTLPGLPTELGGLQGGFGGRPEKGCDGPSSEAAFFDSACFSGQGQG